MLEKMFTTKMSADKKKLQNRFLKIRSSDGKTAKLFGGILLVVIILTVLVISVVIAVKNTENYKMTDDEFSRYINRAIGSVMAEIDYIDNEKLVFHYLEGFFVIDRENNEILHKINLKKLNIAGHQQGEVFTEFKVDKNGEFAYLTNGGNQELIKVFDNYIINLKTGAVKVGDMPEETELFENYADTFSSVKDIYGWSSNRCIVDGNKTYYLTTQDSIIAAIQLVTVRRDLDDVEMSYVFGTNYISFAQRKTNIIKESLKEDEEILTNSGFIWEVNDELVKAVLDKLNETRQMKKIDIKSGNYDVRLYNIWSNDEGYPMLFIIDNHNLELVLSIRISNKEHTDIHSILSMPEIPQTEFEPKDIKGITHAELVVNKKVYPVLVNDNLKNIEKMLSDAKAIKGSTGCSFTAFLIMTNKAGEKGVVTLATDSCAVFKSGDTYYDYSDGDNSEMLRYFGLDSKTIIDMTFPQNGE